MGEAQNVISDMINKGIRAEGVVVDPSRKDCDKGLSIWHSEIV